MLPPSEQGSQRIFRVRLSSPEGNGSFRLLLKLSSPQRYRIDATHRPFNRPLWSLDVHGDEALLVDYLQKLHCRYQDEAEISAVPLGPFPFESLPKLLLGYLPLSPHGPVVAPTAQQIDYRDRRGRRWSAWLSDRVVERWVLWRRGSESVAWSTQGGWAQLEADDDQLSLRWRETHREAMTNDIRVLEPPRSSSAGNCDLGWINGVEDAESLLED